MRTRHRSLFRPEWVRQAAVSNPWLASTVSLLPIVFALGVLFLCMPRPLPTADGGSGIPWWAP